MKFSEAEIRRRAVAGLLHEVPLKHERSDDDMNRAAPLIPAGVISIGPVPSLRRPAWAESRLWTRPEVMPPAPKARLQLQGTTFFGSPAWWYR